MKQSLATHTSIAEQIKEQADHRRFLEALQAEHELVNYQNTERPVDFIEEAACQQEDLVRVLRLACLHSVVNSGLKPKVLEAYRRNVMHCYGYKHMLSLYNLDRLGLLSPQQPSTRNYPVLRKRLNLTLDDVNEQNPNDVAYVHSVYAPLSIRLIENFYKPGWRSIRDVLELLPGPTLEESQPISVNLRKQSQRGPDDTKVTLVLFVGGCTYAEVSALRYLSQKEDAPTEFLVRNKLSISDVKPELEILTPFLQVATTSMINGGTFLQSLMTEVDDAMDY